VAIKKLYSSTTQCQTGWPPCRMKIPRCKVWLTPVANAREACSNAANIGEHRRDLDAVHFAPGKIPLGGQKPPKRIHSVPPRRRPNSVLAVSQLYGRFRFYKHATQHSRSHLHGFRCNVAKQQLLYSGVPPTSCEGSPTIAVCTGNARCPGTVYGRVGRVAKPRASSRIYEMKSTASNRNRTLKPGPCIDTLAD